MKSGKTIQHMLVVALLVAVVWTVAATGTASAATIVVDGVTCTLADAITAANSDTATGGCPAGSGADTLNLVADITLTNRLSAIVSEVTLLGNGHTIQRLPSAPAFRILEIGPYGDATINDVTITGGDDDDGGGILVRSTLVISDSTISGNVADSGGGVHCYLCYMSIYNSTVSGNTATQAGGGLDLFWELPTEKAYSPDGLLSKDRTIDGSWYVQIFDSTIAGNSAQAGGGVSIHGVSVGMEGTTVTGNTALRGGGILNYQGSASLESSTLSGNIATEKGGAIYNESFALEPRQSTATNSAIPVIAMKSPTYGGIIDLSNSTVVENSAPLGAGIYNYHVGPPQYIARLRPSNSILAAQSNGVDCVSEGGAVVESQGYNIESGTTCGFTATGDQQNVSAAQLNLAPLANNGGPTWTHALTPGSAAIDQANCPNVTADQRGYPRPIDQPGVPNAADGCDIGAFELQVPTAVTTTTLAADNRPAKSPPILMIVVVLIASLLLARRWRITAA